MNDQMERDWKRDQEVEREIWSASQHLKRLAEHFQGRKSAQAIQDCLDKLSDEQALIVRRWD